MNRVRPRQEWLQTIAGCLVVAIIIAALGISVVLAVSSPSQKAGTNIYSPPASINATCAHDVTYSFGNWLESVPNGSPGGASIAQLQKGACYEINGTIWWRGPREITLDMNGAKIKQMSTAIPDAIIGGRNIPTVAPYCGSTAHMNDLYSAVPTNVLFISVEGGCDITIENGTIIGTHPQGGSTPALQPDSFISFYGTQRALVNHVNMTGPYGDFVTITGLHEAPGGGGGMPSTDITVENGTFRNAGRCGISETNGAHRVLVTNDFFSGAGLTMFDIELDINYAAPIETDINITHNTISGTANYSYLISAQTGSELQRVAFVDNTLTSGAQIRIYAKTYEPTPGVSNSFIVEGNTSTSSTTWAVGSPVIVYNMTPASVLVANNVDPAPSYGGASKPFATVAAGALACGDETPTGKALDAVCPATLPVASPPVAAALPQ